jgi:polysaccharide export outer membrane protein
VVENRVQIGYREAETEFEPGQGVKVKETLMIALILGVAGTVAAQSQKPPAPVPPQAQEPAPSAANKDFVIGLEDVLSVYVWREPDLSVKEVTVRPDGKITIPLINDIQAAGLTADQLQERITEQLKDFVASPNVTVVVVKVMSQKVSIVGEVGQPGVYPLGGPMTVLELLARAGGFREYAKKKNIAIVRQEGGRSVRYKFNYKDVSEGKNLQQNIALKNGDIVIVP